MTWLNRVKRDFVEDATPYKSVIETSMYKQANMMSSMQIVAGPDIERHIRQGREYVARTSDSIIQIVELDWHVHAKQTEWLEAGDEVLMGNPCWYPVLPVEDFKNGFIYNGASFKHIKEGIQLVESNISDIIRPARFIDADLMGTIDGPTGPDISNTLMKQVNFYQPSNIRKAFIFTVCLRPAGKKNTCQYIKELAWKALGSVIDISYGITLTGQNTIIRTNGFKGVGVHRYNVSKIGGRLEDISVYSYNEKGSPMLTGIFIYK